MITTARRVSVGALRRTVIYSLYFESSFTSIWLEGL